MAYFWKIEESVGGGRYIVFDGIFETCQAAEQAINAHRSNQHMRAELYRTGGWRGGSQRASEEV
jgi:hypothetical protein